MGTTLKFGRVIKSLCDKKGLNRSDLSRATKLSYGCLTNLFNDVNDNVELRTLETVAEALDTDVATIVNLAYNESSQILPSTTLPVMGYANTEKPQTPFVISQDGSVEGKALSVIKTSVLQKINSYALIVCDDIMDPIKKDWIIVASANVPCEDEDLVIFTMKGKILFRQVKFNENLCIFHTIKNLETPIVIPKTEISVMHKVNAYFTPSLSHSDSFPV